MQQEFVVGIWGRNRCDRGRRAVGRNGSQIVDQQSGSRSSGGECSHSQAVVARMVVKLVIVNGTGGRDRGRRRMNRIGWSRTAVVDGHDWFWCHTSWDFRHSEGTWRRKGNAEQGEEKEEEEVGKEEEEDKSLFSSTHTHLHSLADSNNGPNGRNEKKLDGREFPTREIPAKKKIVEHDRMRKRRRKQTNN